MHKTKPAGVEASLRPNWDRLFEFAVGQEGHVTTQQAAAAGYSPQLLAKYLKNGRMVRARRGVYRLVHFPAGEHEDLATLWLWSEQAGVFSHETALMLLDLSDALPRKVHLTLPAEWATRRLRVPDGVVIHHATIPKKERTAIGVIPITTALRTLADCVEAHVSPELLEHAIHQSSNRGLITKSEAPRLRRFAAIVTIRSRVSASGCGACGSEMDK